MLATQNVVRDVASAPLSRYHLTSKTWPRGYTSNAASLGGGWFPSKRPRNARLLGAPRSAVIGPCPALRLREPAPRFIVRRGARGQCRGKFQFVLPRFAGCAGRSAARVCRPRDDHCVCVGALAPA